MRFCSTIFLLLCCTLTVCSQTVITTIVPREAVVQGESFQVQYVLEGSDKNAVFKTPLFPDFRIITGPNVYAGSIRSAQGTKPVQNAVITLEAIRPGRFPIPGIQVTLNGVAMRSEEAFVQVISVAEASSRQKKENRPGSELVSLYPGEDPAPVIQKNLFLRVEVNKQQVYPGEPVVATFKLYSRLESRSDIVRNPGFYGFAVVDMLNLADQEKGQEKLNGDLFDVHIIRRVQLFPEKPGEFTIDEMEVKNKIYFITDRKQKQPGSTIREGVFGKDDDPAAGKNSQVFETEMHSEPVRIVVKPFPAALPADYSGATGQFSMQTLTSKSELYKNEEGVFIIRITGTGNFTQLAAPVVNWPAGVEGFEPAIHDSLDKKRPVLAGYREFRYTFLAAPGKYALPAIRYNYFDPVRKSFFSLRSDSVKLVVNNEEKKAVAENNSRPAEFGNKSTSWVAAGIVVFCVIGSLIYWIFIRKEPEKELKAIPKPVIRPAEKFLPAAGDTDAVFYRDMQAGIYAYYQQFFMEDKIFGKSDLMDLLAGKIEDSPQLETLRHCLDTCELVLYTGVVPDKTQGEWLEMITGLLNQTGEKLQ
ncbi:MAG: BatD family protein [Chitinophagaceae bacterium]|nr:BatD family protein [Chitinophagaceae bacterium]